MTDADQAIARGNELMSEELDTIFYRMSNAATHCYDLNRYRELKVEEQTIFYHYGEEIIMMIGQMHGAYDSITASLAIDGDARDELLELWAKAITDLETFRDSMEDKNMRDATGNLAFAYDRSYSILHSLLR